MSDRWLCPCCNGILTEDAWSRLPRITVETEYGSRTDITCPICGFQSVGIAWVRAGWQPEQDRIASCEAGHERITPAPKEWSEKAILVIPPDDTEPFFPACRTCPQPGVGLIQVVQGEDGVLHLVKVCTIKFRDVEVDADV